MNKRLRRRTLGLMLGVVALSGVLVGAALASDNGGSGSTGPNGHVGSLQVDRSTLQDVIAVAGVPQAVGSGQIIGATRYPAFESLGYSCQEKRGEDLTWISGAGPWCRTVFYVNERTRRLAGLWSATARYQGPRGIRPGMSASVAERRVHKRVGTGCRLDFELGTTHTRAVLWVDVDGGRGVREPGSNAWVLLGGRIGYLALESNRHPVGLLFC